MIHQPAVLAQVSRRVLNLAAECISWNASQSSVLSFADAAQVHWTAAVSYVGCVMDSCNYVYQVRCCLQDCHGKPDDEIKLDLTDAADKVMEMYEKLR